MYAQLNIAHSGNEKTRYEASFYKTATVSPEVGYFVGAKGVVYPAQALWNGIREGEGKGLRRTGVRRAAAAAPGPGRGGRVLGNGMCCAEPAAAGPSRSGTVRSGSSENARTVG